MGPSPQSSTLLVTVECIAFPTRTEPSDCRHRARAYKYISAAAYLHCKQMCAIYSRSMRCELFTRYTPIGRRRSILFYYEMDLRARKRGANRTGQKYTLLTHIGQCVTVVCCGRVVWRSPTSKRTHTVCSMCVLAKQSTRSSCGSVCLAPFTSHRPFVFSQLMPRCDFWLSPGNTAQAPNYIVYVFVMGLGYIFACFE